MANKRKASASASGSKSASHSSHKKSKAQKVPVVDSDFVDEPVVSQDDSGTEEDVQVLVGDAVDQRKIKRRVGEEQQNQMYCRFLGKHLPQEEALRRWPHRYQKKEKKKLNQTTGSKGSNGDDDSEDVIYATHHFIQAEVDGHVFNLDDDAYVQAEDGKENYICKIKEFFQGEDAEPYFSAQWFYRAEDTVIQNCKDEIDVKRIFLSKIRNDNPLDCLVKKLKINRISKNMDPKLTEEIRLDCDYYYDMMYLLPYCSFVSLPNEDVEVGNESDSTISTDSDVAGAVNDELNVLPRREKLDMALLDLYCGCGAMSTGLCLGANSNGIKLTTKWAVDLNQYACQSLGLNHPETQVRNESADNFLALLKEWEKLCVAFSLFESSAPPHPFLNNLLKEEEEKDEKDDVDDDDDDQETFEVEEILDICFGNPKENGKTGLYFKIRWKGYGAEEDTWEPIDGLSDCPKKVKEFVTRGVEKEILPLPGNVDVICGGPPCQGISGFNRFRNMENPLADEKNMQLIVYMNIVGHLRPRFVLMENVVDIVKFAKGYLARYAFGRLVGMNYQARLGMMAAGAYGLPQFRMRIFLWGALAEEKLPWYPLPTHDVVVRGVVPKEYESNLVAYEEGSKLNLKKELFLGDAISDLPPVENNETRDEIPYSEDPKTEFQRFIRLKRGEMPGSVTMGTGLCSHLLYDHQPLRLNDDDHGRVCQIPKKKGSNFRHLPGVRVRPDNKVEWDPAVKRVLLPSGKPLVPDYAMTFVKGTSSKPFGRLWYDQTVPTVITRAEPHNHALLHPFQDRVLTIRENARLQGFPDYYKLVGPIKERYIQVGNAVAVPVARALGYSLAATCRGLSNNEPVFTLPEDYPNAIQVSAQRSPSPGVDNSI